MTDNPQFWGAVVSLLAFMVIVSAAIGAWMMAYYHRHYLPPEDVRLMSLKGRR